MTTHGLVPTAAEPYEVSAFREAQLALFRVSVLKQAKWRELYRAVGPTTNLDALDLGADNGVISWLFRQQGGRWTSADLTDETVDAIRRMVGRDVHQLRDSGELPFPDAGFDRIVVVDLLEHVADDRRLLAEIARCLRPGGRAVLNVPFRKAGALPPLRHALGLTDAWHGHRRPGYRVEELQALLPPTLRLTHAHTYSRFFSHALDTALNAAWLHGSRGRAVSTAKGMVVTGAQVRGGPSAAMQRVFPLLRAWAALDGLLPFTRGYMLLAIVERVGDSASGAAGPSSPS